MSKLKGIIQRLSDVREVWTEGKFCDHVRQIHHYRNGQLSFPPNNEVKLTAVVNMLMASIAMSKSCDMQVRW